MSVLGQVIALRRFPVKSMAGELLDAAHVHWTGIVGDRQYAFVRSADRSHFPWLTGRQAPVMLRHAAAYDGDPRTGRVRVTTLEGAERDVADPALAASLASFAREPVHLMRIGNGCHDAMPVSLLGTGSLAAIEVAHGAAHGAAALDPLRFRANILIDTAEDPRDWAGRTIAVGAARLRADWAIPRCAMIGIDPATAARDPTILRTVARRFGGTAGIYATVVSPGAVRAGDDVTLASDA